MIKIDIDNRTFEVEAGRSILSIAGEGGIKIPALCHFEGIEDDASCLICSVKNKKDGTLVPACSTVAEDGMEIDTKCGEVINFRKKIVEMLVMEHRAECEAPCHPSCPGNYNIPLLNKYLANGKIKDALSLLASEIGSSPLLCLECDGYCEKTCRRGKIDTPVSIKSIRIFLYSHLDSSIVKREENVTTIQQNKTLFNSKTGELSENEIKESLKECSGKVERCSVIDDYISAGYEAGSCMQCRCRAADDCSLRDLATELGVEDEGIKVKGYTIQKKISTIANLVYENAKCIKCGLCVRSTSDRDGRIALCFRNRGIGVKITEPLGVDFYYIPADKAEIYVSICPTGALRRFKTD